MPPVGTAAELADLIAARGPAVVLTGAGMSTESGIPDFRSAAGLWAEVDPFEVASIDAFRRDPLRVWRWYGPRIDDPTLFRGEKVVEQIGVPPRSTAVTRRVFASDGTLMYDTTWRSYYVGEPTVVRLGTKPRPKPEEPKAKGDAKAKPGATAGVTPPADQETASTTTATPRP